MAGFLDDRSGDKYKSILNMEDSEDKYDSVIHCGTLSCAVLLLLDVSIIQVNDHVV